MDMTFPLCSGRILLDCFVLFSLFWVSDFFFLWVFLALAPRVLDFHGALLVQTGKKPFLVFLTIFTLK